MTDGSSSETGLRARLEGASHDLLYTSESDRPFEWFFLAGGGEGWPYGAEEFARRVGAAGESAEEITLEKLFARHIERADPADEVMQRLRPRFEALREMLRRSLADARVFRVGSVEVKCYAVGGDGEGNLAGLSTVSVET